MTISLDREGQIQIKAPFWVPQFQIKRFVTDHLDWIVKNQAKVKKQRPLTTISHVWLFGQAYQRVWTGNQTYPLGTSLEANKVVFRPPSTLKTAQVTDLGPLTDQVHHQANISLQRFLQQAASTYITQRTHVLAEKMEIKFGQIRFRQQASRWGSCSSRGNLNFNWRLVHFAPEVIDYVIIHELAHRQEMNHSRDFWRIVAKYDPQYKLHQKALKGATLD